ncbi:tRNA (guanosine(46)-N(7))-methyltransferase TrmB [Phyllobacterium sp. 21LDTY02-6]|jgi:tRNA (guanine-N7-)-methyltransferase|uniref:tRNA (guanine(46)-N(7))-methyltransferase TrmB n=1 Tax=unclassified Phyllobacterium TaxID=2638441 RepID=UPI0020212C42|nr:MULTISPECIES: tRNA (guanosine(46)-N(7))-methyltransferase TrmB [unclassified Phyllobacterium]MCO4316898.1 tRNA (guanosine(46)-N(7))-methyltransferase TrmB [Phyllobacterium sp. 21LDTY02-6]MCX8281821.1 tRNA (guanosine(46)-N(7))-methyltransferase TrmB [Phyllobacterium sp. 0TCS1.6C]MCX8295356.1 tRNA (guanosine(46)-N(7))-methyltransferase TrmB [Phyllobacterium sp. 0TCS1.6A]
MTEARRARSTEAFFGRRAGKTLRPLQRSIRDELLPVLKLDLDQPAPADLRSLFSAEVGAVRLEIGFGGGEHLLHEAARCPMAGFIGVEPFVNSMAKLVVDLHANPLQNIRLYDDDATQVLDWLPEASLDGIDLFYPDPWPKKKHWKRRFVSGKNLDRFARVLKPGARFRFASDIDTYVNWTLQHCDAHPDFDWQAASPADWHTPYEGWPGTRYEQKAHREGRVGAYLTFRRI